MRASEEDTLDVHTARFVTVDAASPAVDVGPVGDPHTRRDLLTAPARG